MPPSTVTAQAGLPFPSSIMDQVFGPLKIPSD
jgi:hypothetical protein